MKGISIRQPWASLILAGSKTIEVRSRPINFRGDLLICAGASKSGSTSEPRGVALCIVEVVDCMPMRDSDWDTAGISRSDYLFRVKKAAGPIVVTTFFGWHLRNVRPVEQFAVKGQLSLFNVDDRLIRTVEAGFIHREVVRVISSGKILTPQQT